MRSLILAVDVDEVCAALHGEWLRRYNIRFNDNLTEDDITEWDLTNFAKPGTTQAMFDILYEPDLYDHILPISGARNAVYELLGMGHRIVYATSCPEGTIEYKRKWLVRWGFLTPQNQRRDFLPVTDKSLVRADILFDDRPENVATFPGLGVLVTRRHNGRSTHHTRIASLASAPAFVRQLLAA